MHNFLRRKYRMLSILALVIIMHLILLFFINIQQQEKKERTDNSIFKIVDVQELKLEEPKENIVKIEQQEKTAEEIIETEDIIEEVLDSEPNYVPQFKISVVPKMPVELIRERIQYPVTANKQGIEAIVYLELFIDATGLVRKVKVLKDPGYGFAEAAVRALEGIRSIPAKANGENVAVRFRYPVRFQLK